MKQRTKRRLLCLTAAAAIGISGCGVPGLPKPSRDHFAEQEEEGGPGSASAEPGESGPGDGVSADSGEAGPGSIPADAEESGRGSDPAETGETGSGDDVSAETGEGGPGDDVSAETGETVQGSIPVETGEIEETDLNLKFRLVTGEEALSGLPEEVAHQVNAINGGEAPAQAIGSKELKGYYALVATYTVVGEDEASGEETRGSGRLTLYIPNLLEGLEEISFLYYDKAERIWRVIPAEQVDPAAKTVSAILPGSGTLTVVYRRE